MWFTQNNLVPPDLSKIYLGGITFFTLEREISEKEAYLEYLKTPQRIEKEAKIQMGKKLPGEQVLVFVEENTELLPTEQKQQARQRLYTPEVPNWQKWQWVFFGDRG